MLFPGNLVHYPNSVRYIAKVLMTEPRPGQRADTRTVARNAMWNFGGRIGPIVIAFLVTPFLVRALGDERWGAFTIVLSLIGSFGIFDFGLGRALTRAVAESIGSGDRDELTSLVLTGTLAAGVLGLLGGCATACLAGYWVRHGLRVSPPAQHEVQLAAYLLCVAAPLVILSAALWGVLAAYQQFRTTNLISIPISALYYVGPLLALKVCDSLVAVMLVLVASRLLVTVAYGKLCLQIMPSLRVVRPAFRHLWPLLRLGGWMSVSNVTYPLLQNADRFVIASILSGASTGYYSTPFDLVGRFIIVSIAVMNTAFPAMAASFRADSVNTVALFRRSILAIVIIIFPACLVVVGLSTQVMTLWIGRDFAQHAAPVMRWLGLGILFACADAVVAGLIDGIGRSDINAKFSLLEFVLYVPIVMALLPAFGIEGAAMAWAARAGLDFAVRSLLVRRLYKPVASAVERTALAVCVGVLLLAMPLLGLEIISRTALMVAAQILFLGAIWCWALTPREQTILRAWSAGTITTIRLPS